MHNHVSPPYGSMSVWSPAEQIRIMVDPCCTAIQIHPSLEDKDGKSSNDDEAAILSWIENNIAPLALDPTVWIAQQLNGLEKADHSVLPPTLFSHIHFKQHMSVDVSREKWTRDLARIAPIWSERTWLTLYVDVLRQSPLSARYIANPWYAVRSVALTQQDTAIDIADWIGQQCDAVKADPEAWLRGLIHALETGDGKVYPGNVVRLDPDLNKHHSPEGNADGWIETAVSWLKTDPEGWLLNMLHAVAGQSPRRQARVIRRRLQIDATIRGGHVIVGDELCPNALEEFITLISKDPIPVWRALRRAGGIKANKDVLAKELSRLFPTLGDHPNAASFLSSSSGLTILMNNTISEYQMYLQEAGRSTQLYDSCFLWENNDRFVISRAKDRSLCSFCGEKTSSNLALAYEDQEGPAVIMDGCQACKDAIDEVRARYERDTPISDPGENDADVGKWSRASVGTVLRPAIQRAADAIREAGIPFDRLDLYDSVPGLSSLVQALHDEIGLLKPDPAAANLSLSTYYGALALAALRTALESQPDFRLSKPLTASLALTDVKGIPSSQIRLPYGCQRVIFPAGLARFRAHDVRAVIVSEWRTGADDDHRILSIMAVGDAAGTTLNKMFSAWTVELRDDHDASTASSTVPLGDRMMTHDGGDASKLLTRLVLNAALYISLPNADVRLEGADELRRLREQLNKHPKGSHKRERAAKKVKEAESKPKVHHVGWSIKIPGSMSDAVFGSGVGAKRRGFTASWTVRGHWRNQAIGVGRKEHKVMWIQPFVKRRDLGARLVRPDYEVS